MNRISAIKEHDRAALAIYIPDVKPTVGVVVHLHDGGKAFEAEFVALDGGTMAVVTLECAQILPVKHHEITPARRVA
jgi:hypothetical protein